jgi:hypothetical protein
MALLETNKHIFPCLPSEAYLEVPYLTKLTYLT